MRLLAAPQMHVSGKCGMKADLTACSELLQKKDTTRQITHAFLSHDQHKAALKPCIVLLPNFWLVLSCGVFLSVLNWVHNHWIRHLHPSCRSCSIEQVESKGIYVIKQSHVLSISYSNLILGAGGVKTCLTQQAAICKP